MNGEQWSMVGVERKNNSAFYRCPHNRQGRTVDMDTAKHFANKSDNHCVVYQREGWMAIH